MADEFIIKFLYKKKLTHNAYAFYFEKPKGIKYSAGQYLKIKLDIKNPDARGASRYFTIASLPEEPELIILTKVIKSSFKKELNDLEKGEKVIIRAPYGNFTFGSKQLAEKILISSGTGIVPFRNMTITSLKTNKNDKISIAASFESKRDFLFKEELFKLKKQYINLSVEYYELNKNGGISNDIVKKYIANNKNSVYYIAGAESFVSATENLLTKNKIKSDRIISEDFPGYLK